MKLIHYLLYYLYVNFNRNIISELMLKEILKRNF